jgi:flagellar FliL protein
MTTIIIILVLLVAAGGGVFLYMRLRSGDSIADLPPPDIGDLVDYTSEPEPDEPPTLGERLAGMSTAFKALLVLVPLVLLVGVITVAFLFLPTPSAGDSQTTTPEVSITKADLIDEETIRVNADTTLADGTEVTIELLEDDERFEWIEDGQASVEVSGGEIAADLTKVEDAPGADRDAEHMVRIFTEVQGETVEDETELVLPPSQSVQAAFYEAPATPTPTRTPRPSPTPDFTLPLTPTEEPTSTPEPLEGIAVTVGNGGNVRAQPSASAEVVGQVALGDEVMVRQKTPDDIWFEIETPGFTGWAHTAVMRMGAETVAQIPVQGEEPPPPAAESDDAEEETDESDEETGSTGLTASVFNGGNMRAQPIIANNIVGGVNAGETVELLEKTSDGVWYKVRNERDEVGWTHNTLITIPPDLAEQVPVAQG